MIETLRKAWPGFLLALAFLLFVDGIISSLLTCHPQSDSYGNYQPNQEDCTVLKGPLASGVVFLGGFFEEHDKGIVALFTIILAVSTILLWWATYGLQKTTRDLAEAGDEQIKISTQIAEAATAANERTREIERAYISGGGAPETRTKNVRPLTLSGPPALNPSQNLRAILNFKSTITGRLQAKFLNMA